MNRLIVAAIGCLLTFILPKSKAKKATLLLLSVAMLVAGGAAAVRGQSALNGFDPNANNAVFSIAVQADSKILIGGVFTTLSPNGGPPVTRNYIARLNPDGTLDTAFNANFQPNANTWVNAIAVQSDGKILLGGQFFNEPIGGQTRNNIARLNPNGTLDTAFNPNANNDVYTIAVQADGKVLVGGDFSSIGGQLRNDIARLNPMTGLADSFNPNPSGNLRGPQVDTITVQADGKILVGGIFTSIGGKTRYNIARLDPVTGLADSFAPNPMGPRVEVFSIAVQADGKILVGGMFTQIRGQMRNDIARVDPTTGLADSFNPNGNNAVLSIAVQTSGKILVGGDFSSIGGQPRTYIARLNPMTGLADSFNPNANSFVRSIAVQTSGKILVGGIFTHIGGQPRNHIARLDPTTGLAD